MARGGVTFAIPMPAASAWSDIRGWSPATPISPSFSPSARLTNLYNERPTWLDLAHRRLDAAVFAAYNWDPALTDDQLLENLLALNLERASAK
jgi:hypothetical protein